MDPFQLATQFAPKPVETHPQNALMVVDNRQLQLWSSPSVWPTHYDANAASALVDFSTAATGQQTPATRSPQSSSTSSSPAEPQKRKTKKRKATHTIRKEQKAALEKEIQELQARLDAIKFQALVQQGEASKSTQDRVVENAVLRESIQDQHLVLAQVRAMLSGHTQQHFGGVRPMETKICLGADRAERRGVLHALRGAKLRGAKEFLRARSHALSPRTPYFQEERYESVEGDFCITRFEIIPLRGVKGGVRAVFDAVLQAAFNAEIIISETSGNITIREEDADLNDDSVSQMRLVSQTHRGVLLENNLVHFAEFSRGDESGKGSYAMTATDFVDEDDLYPYRPFERVRRDATAAMLVTSYRETKKGSRSREDGELVVVVTRWSCSKICHTDLNLPHDALMDLRETSIRSSGTFFNCVRDSLGLPVNPS